VGTMITKDNLEALCMICSGSVPTNGEMQNYVILIVHSICLVRSIWKLKMTNGSTVALHLIRVMVVYIENTVVGNDE